MRWRIDLSYLGTNYSGWQKQPGDKTVQQTIEEAFGVVLREPVEMVGCGRTDAGVHARRYTAHLDVKEEHDTSKVLYQVNSVLPDDIGIISIAEAADHFHARFDAVQRHYKYYVHFHKDPFAQHISYRFDREKELDRLAMIRSCMYLKEFKEFLPFCKTGSDVNNYRCELTKCLWFFTPDGKQAIFIISANRFLRGMVRLMVGATLNVGLGKLSEDKLMDCMETQTPLPVQWSVPAHGLFLEEVGYDPENLYGSGWKAYPTDFNKRME